MFKYAADTTTVEIVDQWLALRHIGAGRPTEKVPAAHTMRPSSMPSSMQSDLGVKVNCKKTQLLCFSQNNGYTLGGHHLGRGHSHRHAGQDETPQVHARHFPGSLSTGGIPEVQISSEVLDAVLRRAGITGTRLFKMYAALVRPVLETNCVAFHPMLTANQAQELERLQKMMLRLCFPG